MILHDLLDKIKSLSGRHDGAGFKETGEIIGFDDNGIAMEKSGIFRKIFLSLVIVLIALLSFSLGRLSSVGEREAVRIEYDQSNLNTTEDDIEAENTASAILKDTSVVASKNGAKYHYLHCSGAKNIRDENKITFQTAEAAEAAGYTMAANCSPQPK